jgi:hypothetical protein
LLKRAHDRLHTIDDCIHLKSRRIVRRIGTESICALRLFRLNLRREDG